MMINMDTKVTDVDWGGGAKHRKTRILRVLRIVDQDFGGDFYGPGKIETVGDLLKWSPKQLMRIPNCGMTSAASIVETLHQLGLKLQDSA